MSSGTKPRGREYNPRGYIVGTQAQRFINVIAFAVGVATIGGGYLFMKFGPKESKLLNFVQKKIDDKQYETDLLITQQRLKALREARLREIDPLYKQTEERRRLGLNSNPKLEVTESANPIVPGSCLPTQPSETKIAPVVSTGNASSQQTRT